MEPQEFLRKYQKFGPRFYYCYHEFGDEDKEGRPITIRRPVVTVCVLKTLTGKFVRGISACHPNDQPVKAKGRDKASGRVIQYLTRVERGIEPPEVVMPISTNTHSIAAQAMGQELFQKVSTGRLSEQGYHLTMAGEADLTAYEERLFKEKEDAG